MNERDDLRTRGVVTWSQTQKVGMSDEKTHCKKEAEKAKVETWGQTQKVFEKEMSDKEARHKKEAEKAKREIRGVETWGQTQSEDDDKVDETPASKTGLGNYYPNPMNCGDCYFETHYENELFDHLKMHMDQSKKHTIIAHNGHKNTTWMFCGDCEYATRVEEELVNHVKHHQLFSILGDDKDDDVPIDDDEDDETPVSKTGRLIFFHIYIVIVHIFKVLGTMILTQ